MTLSKAAVAVAPPILVNLLYIFIRLLFSGTLLFYTLLYMQAYLIIQCEDPPRGGAENMLPVCEAIVVVYPKETPQLEYI